MPDLVPLPVLVRTTASDKGTLRVRVPALRHVEAPDGAKTRLRASLGVATTTDEDMDAIVLVADLTGTVIHDFKRDPLPQPSVLRSLRMTTVQWTGVVPAGCRRDPAKSKIRSWPAIDYEIGARHWQATLDVVPEGFNVGRLTRGAFPSYVLPVTFPEHFQGDGPAVPLLIVTAYVPR